MEAQPDEPPSHPQEERVVALFPTNTRQLLLLLLLLLRLILHLPHLLDERLVGAHGNAHLAGVAVLRLGEEREKIHAGVQAGSTPSRQLVLCMNGK